MKRRRRSPATRKKGCRGVDEADVFGLEQILATRLREAVQGEEEVTGVPFHGSGGRSDVHGGGGEE